MTARFPGSGAVGSSPQPVSPPATTSATATRRLAPRRRCSIVSLMTFDESGDPFEPNGEHDGDTDARLDEDFPLGDGTADTAAVVLCPYCGEENEIAVDPGSGESQDYIEDCQVCCQPWRVSVTYDNTGSAHVYLEAADDA